MRNSDGCPWHPAVRWLAFLPLGIVATGIAQGLLRLANSDTPFIAEVLSRVIEPWAFFFVSLWVLPRFHRAFMAVVSGLYLLVYLSTIYLATVDEGFSSQPWADYTISAVAIVSCGASVYYFMNETYVRDTNRA